MAGQRFSAPVNFNNQDTVNLKVPVLAADPAVKKVGNVWVNSTSHVIKAQTDTGTTVTLTAGTVLNKFGVTVGDGVATSYVITHNLNTTDVTVQAFVISTGVNSSNVTSITRTSVNALTIVFGAAPATNTVRVVVFG